MSRPITHELREYASCVAEIEQTIGCEMLRIADAIDADYKGRIHQCKVNARRSFARFLRSSIEDYERGIARANRNHAHRHVSVGECGIGECVCTSCGCEVGPYDRFCHTCGAKLTATEYEERGA